MHADDVKGYWFHSSGRYFERPNVSITVLVSIIAGAVVIVLPSLLVETWVAFYFLTMHDELLSIYRNDNCSDLKSSAPTNLSHVYLSTSVPHATIRGVACSWRATAEFVDNCGVRRGHRMSSWCGVGAHVASVGGRSAIN